MSATPQILIVSTDDDASLKLLCAAAPTQFKVTTIPYTISQEKLNETLSTSYDFIYFRDPFNSAPLPKNIIENTGGQILAACPKAYSVDSVQSYEDMLFEDKWRQYQAFSTYMPQTEVLQSTENINLEKYIIKKRISSRARGIILSAEQLSQLGSANEYIVQKRLPILVEYRVYMVGSEVILPLAIKSSKTVDQKVKVIGTNNTLALEMRDICHAVYSHTLYDLMGLDIIQTDEGYYLLEVNRSCQFKGYLRESQINLADRLYQYLLSKR